MEFNSGFKGLRGWSLSFKNIVVHTDKQSHFFRLWIRRQRLC